MTVEVALLLNFNNKIEYEKKHDIKFVSQIYVTYMFF